MNSLTVRQEKLTEKGVFESTGKALATEREAERESGLLVYSQNINDNGKSFSV
jgi:hypothetical protein